MKKLLIIGRGQVGSALAHDLSEFKIEVWTRDIEDLTIEEISASAPDAIINAAGRTDLAWCEANPRETWRSNAEAPIALYKTILQYNRTSERKVRFIHFSSGCIWDGPFDAAGNPFTPQSVPTPACLYSLTKASADEVMLDMDAENIAILRPRQVYSSSASPRNTLVKLLRYPKLIDTPNSMSSMAVIEAMVRYAITATDWSGAWNVYDRGIVTPFEVASMLASAGLRDMPLPLTKQELDAFHTPKRVDTVLHDARFEEAITPNDVRIELEGAIARLKERLQEEVTGSVR